MKTTKEVEKDMRNFRATWKNLPPGYCRSCDDESYIVKHFGSPFCESNGLGASNGQGYRSHCTCDRCF